ncbi:MAG: hypothetical protein ACLR8Y_08770 [Alistipes indistinctus]
MLIVAVFLWQCAGLGLRWYISGRAPWTNAYESMVYVRLDDRHEPGWSSPAGYSSHSALATLMGGGDPLRLEPQLARPQITRFRTGAQILLADDRVSVITASYGFFGIAQPSTDSSPLVAMIAGRPRLRPADHRRAVDADRAGAVSGGDLPRGGMGQ